MGKITINEIHKSLFDYVQAVSDNNLETNNKTIVGAINELLQKSNNEETPTESKTTIHTGEFSSIWNENDTPVVFTPYGTTKNANHYISAPVTLPFEPDIFVAIGYVENVPEVQYTIYIYKNIADESFCACTSYQMATKDSQLNVFEIPEFNNGYILPTISANVNYKYAAIMYGEIDDITNQIADGKQLIADAIGEPLEATDTFEDMAYDINGLLNTFKINMINKGITVENNDKFKRLIDKIATIAGEDSSNKKWVYGESSSVLNARESFTYVSGYTESRPYVDITGLDFIPSTIVYISKSDTSHFGTLQNIKKRTSMDLPEIVFIDNTPTSNSNVRAYVFLANDNVFRSDGIIRLPIVIESATDFIWIAYGEGDATGEGDTTNTGLDIISATELPATGKENQICAITDNPVNNFKITNLIDEVLTDGTIYVKLGTGTGPTSGNVELGSTIKMVYHVDAIYQNGKTLRSYIYQNNQWVEFTKTGITILLDGEYTADTATYGQFKERDEDVYMDEGFGLFMDTGLVSASRSGYVHSYLPQKIDFSGFTTVSLTLKEFDYGGGASTNVLGYLYFYDSIPDVSLLADPEEEAVEQKVTSLGRSDFDSYNVTYDITSIKGTYYIGFCIYTPADTSGYYFSTYLSDFSIM